ncbi:MAG: dihydrofolate reductase [Actinomycetota bacterium]|jgi:dihydrofolate reductase|nr:dihydrofolate reductase [Actinomycetota bacterium]
MIGLVWAQAANGVIGRAGTLPWRLPEDLAHFKALTLGSTVVMGRLTWESLPPRMRPLPGRRNIVLTRHTAVAFEGAEVAHSLEEALAMSETDVWVMGGAQVYAAALPLAERLVVTELSTPVDGDAHAPPIDAGWRREAFEAWRHSSSGLDFRITTYERAR